MKLINALREECVQIGSKPIDKKSLLKEIAQCSKRSRVLSDFDENTIFTALENRESLGTTGFGKHIAIPHCSLEDIDEFVVGIIIHNKGVEFDALDGQKVNLFVFIIGPKAQRNEHIHLLSKISRVLNNSDAVSELLSEKSAVAVRETFLRYAIDEVDAKDIPEKSLFHIFVQIEDKLEDILQIFSEIESCSASIVRADDTSYYLNKLPLFSGFFSENSKGFNRLIIAVVPKTMANEVIRQIDDIAGNLNVNPGIMVLMQDIFFWRGSLNY